ncbi:MAG TPA: methyl-accepting chemotaxis protein, partial [Spirochaetota bacterium]|nr:methyl-accepting chemotaxis protein [Spirochaetota bacterium]
MLSVNNLSTRAKFIVFIAIITTIVCIGLLISLRFTTIMKSEITSIYEIHMQGIDFLIEADRDAYQSSIAISHFINLVGSMRKAAEADVSATFKKDIDENLEQTQTRFRKFENIHKDDKFRKDNRKSFDDFEENYARVAELTPKITELINNGSVDEALLLYKGTYNEAFEKMRDAMNTLTDASLLLAENDYKSAMSAFRQTVINNGILILSIVTVLLIMGVILTRIIKKPIDRTLVLAQAMSLGDFTNTIAEKRGDEFGQMFNALNAFTIKMSQ